MCLLLVCLVVFSFIWFLMAPVDDKSFWNLIIVLCTLAVLCVTVILNN